MSTVNSIKKNSFFSLLSISSRLVANFAVFWFLARFYGPEVFGQFTFAHTLAATFIIFADFGFDVLLTTEIARNRTNASETFQQYFSLKLIFTIASMLAMWFFGLIVNLSEISRQLILIFSFYIVFTTLTNFLFALFKGFEKLNYETRVSLLLNSVLLILTGVFIYFHMSVIVIAIGFLFSRLIGFIFGIKFSRHVLPKIKYRLIYSGFNRIKGKMFVYGFHFLFSYLFFQLDTILLAFLKDEYHVGIYQAGFKLIVLALVIPEIINSVLLPVLSRLNVENKLEWEKVGFLMSKVYFIIVIPIAMIFFIYAEQIVNFIYGTDQYAFTIPVLKIFALVLVVRFLWEPFGLLLTSLDKQKLRMVVVITATIFNFILNFFLIPQYGVEGAAIVSLITNSSVGAVFFLALGNYFSKWFINLRTMAVILFSSTVFYILNYEFDLSIFIGIPMLLIFFFLFTFFFFFTKEEKRLLFSGQFSLNLLKL